jgi:hypothetical protein
MTLLSKIIFIVTVTLTFDPKIYRIFPLPQWNHVTKFGKDPIYRTKIIVRKPVWTPGRHTQSHNTARLETGVYKFCKLLIPKSIVTYVMIVTVKLNMKFINKTYCLLNLFLEFNKQNSFLMRIIPTLVSTVPLNHFTKDLLNQSQWTLSYNNSSLCSKK